MLWINTKQGELGISLLTETNQSLSLQELTDSKVLISLGKCNTISHITLQEQGSKQSGLGARWSHQAYAELKLSVGSCRHGQHQQRLQNEPSPWVCGPSTWLLFATMADKLRVLCPAFFRVVSVGSPGVGLLGWQDSRLQSGL